MTLTEILGTALAFSSVMLLFSMIVTTTVQAIQATFDLRYHNLRRGLLKIVDQVEGIGRRQLDQGLDKLLYFRGQRPSSGILNCIGSLFAIRKTEITIEELNALIRREIENVSDQMQDQVVSAFGELEQYMSKLYQRVMHLLSIVIAMILAFAFQLNSFDLLAQLSVSPEMRNSLIETVQVIGDKADHKPPFQSLPEIKRSALDELKKTPDYSELSITSISSDSLSVNEIQAQIEKQTGSSQIAREYESIVDRLFSEREEKTLDALQQQLALAGKFQFSIKTDVREYYWESKDWFSNLFGTLVSSTLISLGAPFWFNAIRNITSMRDRTSRRAQT